MLRLCAAADASRKAAEPLRPGQEPGAQRNTARLGHDAHAVAWPDRAHCQVSTLLAASLSISVSGPNFTELVLHQALMPWMTPSKRHLTVVLKHLYRFMELPSKILALLCC